MNLHHSFRSFGKIIRSSFLLLCLSACGGTEPGTNPDVPGDFDLTPVRYPIVPGMIDEASGLAPSKTMDGFYWTHQDSGRPNSLYLMSGDAKTIKEFPVPGAINYDWEDIASGPGPLDGVNYLYIADIGNNNQPVVAENAIYRVQEVAGITGVFEQSKLDKIRFKYPDGPRDAESLILDPVTKDLYILSKEMAVTGIYKLPYPQSTTYVTTAEKVGNVPSVSFATAADLSPDGNEILIRTYFVAYYWRRKSGESIQQTLLRASDKQLLVAPEPQGEGICFDNQSKGFFTISELGEASSVSLNYYKRK